MNLVVAVEKTKSVVVVVVVVVVVKLSGEKKEEVAEEVGRRNLYLMEPEEELELRNYCSVIAILLRWFLLPLLLLLLADTKEGLGLPSEFVVGTRESRRREAADLLGLVRRCRTTRCC